MPAAQLVFHRRSRLSLAGESPFCPGPLAVSLKEIFAGADLIQSSVKCEALEKGFFSVFVCNHSSKLTWAKKYHLSP